MQIFESEIHTRICITEFAVEIQHYALSRKWHFSIVKFRRALTAAFSQTFIKLALLVELTTST